ncbi:MAG: serine hydrolase, partial [Oscillospiraceae bacterium]|nr:serine hydrolase [Oscillospiraceae bacterium]
MTTPVKDDKYARIVKTFDSFLTDPVTPVLGYALTVIEDGKVTFKHAGGYREFDANDPAQCLPMNSETRFRIASISKMFTC